jgi:hypothetical protein
MAPSAIVPEIVDYVQPKKDNLNLPGPTRARLEKANIDLSEGYPVSISMDHWDASNASIVKAALTISTVPPRPSPLSPRRLRPPQRRPLIH